MQRTVRRAVMLVICGVAACETFTAVLGPIPYTAALTGTAVRPASVTTDATGTLAASLNQTTLQWDYTVGWEGLSSAPVSVHLHGPADDAGVAEALVELNTADSEMTPTGSATGSLDLTMAITTAVSGDSLRILLNTGRVYVDVHTANNLTGEIRGHVMRH